MKKLTVYNVYLDDGKSVFRVTVPAASKKEASDYVQGNGDVVAINPAPVQGDRPAPPGLRPQILPVEPDRC